MARVVVGMSGGVDSSAAAVILKKAGYEVVGLTFKFIDDFDASDARLVCEKLGIEHHIVDYTKEFKTEVIEHFLNEYKRGVTPNPCVHCNRFVKIKYLYDQMKELNCDFMATGHYAKWENGKLFRSADLNKDQTYFLSQVPRNMLMHIMFPLEGLEKSDVRQIAEDAGLEVAHKKDSTDVCFIKTTFADFMKDNINITPGNIINIETNEVMGKHIGLPFYTIGQRRGLDIGGTDGRTFVVGKDIEKNILYIAEGTDNDYLTSNECIVEDVNLISPNHPTFATAKFRYRSKEVPVSIEYLEGDKMKVSYEGGAAGVTPGQTCTIYLGEQTIGGGTIKEVMRDGKKLWYL